MLYSFLHRLDMWIAWTRDDDGNPEQKSRKIMKLDKRLRLDRFRSCVAKDRNLILVRGRSSGSEGLRTFPGARSSGWIVHSILAVPFFPPLIFLLATPSSSLEQTRSSHSSDFAPASNPATLPRSHTTLISCSTREKRTPT